MQQIIIAPCTTSNLCCRNPLKTDNVRPRVCSVAQLQNISNANDNKEMIKVTVSLNFISNVSVRYVLYLHQHMLLGPGGMYRLAVCQLLHRQLQS